MPSVAPCFFNPSVNWFLRMPESTEGIPRGNILVTIFPACTAIKHAAAGAVTVKRRWPNCSCVAAPSSTLPLRSTVAHSFTLFRSFLNLGHSICWVSFSIKGKTKENLNRTVGSSCQAFGVMIYLVKFCCQYIIATCHLRWIRRCL